MLPKPVPILSLRFELYFHQEQAAELMKVIEAGCAPPGAWSCLWEAKAYAPSGKLVGREVGPTPQFVLERVARDAYSEWARFKLERELAARDTGATLEADPAAGR